MTNKKYFVKFFHNFSPMLHRIPSFSMFWVFEVCGRPMLWNIPVSIDSSLSEDFKSTVQPQNFDDTRLLTCNCVCTVTVFWHLLPQAITFLHKKMLGKEMKITLQRKRPVGQFCPTGLFSGFPLFHWKKNPGLSRTPVRNFPGPFRSP